MTYIYTKFYFYIISKTLYYLTNKTEIEVRSEATDIQNEVDENVFPLTVR